VAGECTARSVQRGLSGCALGCCWRCSFADSWSGPHPRVGGHGQAGAHGRVGSPPGGPPSTWPCPSRAVTAVPPRPARRPPPPPGGSSVTSMGNCYLGPMRGKLPELSRHSRGACTTARTPSSSRTVGTLRSRTCSPLPLLAVRRLPEAPAPGRPAAPAPAKHGKGQAAALFSLVVPCRGSTNARIIREQPELKAQCDEDRTRMRQHSYADLMDTTLVWHLRAPGVHLQISGGMQALTGQEPVREMQAARTRLCLVPPIFLVLYGCPASVRSTVLRSLPCPAAERGSDPGGGSGQLQATLR